MYPHCSLKPRQAEQADALSWFVIFTPFAEFQVEADLIAMGKKRELALDAYCPAETRWSKAPKSLMRQRSHKPARIQLPLYPGYLFVGLGPDVSQSAVKSVRSDLEFLMQDGGPARFPYARPELRLDGMLNHGSDTIFGLRMQEYFKAFDFTRDARKAAAAARQARLTFHSFADLGAFVTEGRIAA